MKEIKRYPVGQSDDTVLMHVDDDGEETVWAVMFPPSPGKEFDPANHSECFCVASSIDGFDGLNELADAARLCATDIASSRR
jgi:hypothetical protein